MKIGNERIYFYRGMIISNVDKGWVVDYDYGNDGNIYKTIDDAKNSIDKNLGGLGRTSRYAPIPKRHDKMDNIKIIGKVEFIINNNGESGDYVYTFF